MTKTARSMDLYLQIKDYCRQDKASALEKCLLSTTDPAGYMNTPLLLNEVIPGEQQYSSTVLCEACERWSGECVQVLVAHGADVNQADSRGETPLHRVCRSHTDVCAKVRQLESNFRNVSHFYY